MSDYRKPADAGGYIRKYGSAIIGRMIADGAADTSDAEIERTLGPCVCGQMLIVIATEMRRRGVLTLIELEV